MRHGSLESGIGMFDYAAEQMDWENVFHCEINPFCRTVLNYYWPKAKSYANVFGFDGHEWRGKVDIITGGFPCQPFSVAGKREGSSDDRHIWPENMRIVREAQPTWCLFENVPGIIDIENGMVFEQVCLDLENEGYETQTFIIPACATNKDHRRDRIWIVANRVNNDHRGTPGQNEGASRKERVQERNEVQRFSQPNSLHDTDTAEQRLSFSNGKGSRTERQCDAEPECSNWNDPHTNHTGLQGGKEAGNTGSSRTQRNQQFRGHHEKREHWLEAATRLCSLDDGNTGGLDLEAISKSKWRTESLKAYGNTIIWEIAYEIFKAIEQYERAR